MGLNVLEHSLPVGQLIEFRDILAANGDPKGSPGVGELFSALCYECEKLPIRATHRLTLLSHYRTNFKIAPCSITLTRVSCRAFIGETGGLLSRQFFTGRRAQLSVQMMREPSRIPTS